MLASRMYFIFRILNGLGSYECQSRIFITVTFVYAICVLVYNFSPRKFFAYFSNIIFYHGIFFSAVGNFFHQVFYFFGVQEIVGILAQQGYIEFIVICSNKCTACHCFQ